jgi:hypothetical protein
MAKLLGQGGNFLGPDAFAAISGVRTGIKGAETALVASGS